MLRFCDRVPAKAGPGIGRRAAREAVEGHPAATQKHLRAGAIQSNPSGYLVERRGSAPRPPGKHQNCDRSATDRLPRPSRRSVRPCSPPPRARLCASARGSAVLAVLAVPCLRLRAVAWLDWATGREDARAPYASLRGSRMAPLRRARAGRGTSSLTPRACGHAAPLPSAPSHPRRVLAPHEPPPSRPTVTGEA